MKAETVALRALIDECDAEIRAGRISMASRRLAKLNGAKVPRDLRLPLAQICRRAGLLTLALKTLSKVVHSQSLEIEGGPSDAELAEYGVLLMRLGALRESLAILERVDEEVCAEALLYRAYGLFSVWDFEQAIPFLRDYIRLAPSPYWALIAKVNLAYALVSAKRTEQASSVLGELVPELQEKKYARLQANCHELMAQVRFHAREYARAKSELELSADLASAAGLRDHQLVRKWLAFVEAFATGKTEPISKFRADAALAGDWEGVRDSDRYELQLRFDQNRYEHLIFGTSFPSFRSRVVGELGARPLAETFVLGAPTAPCLDLATAKMDDRLVIKPGQKCHQLLDILLRDFYRPLRIAEIFAALFPEEHFDIQTSPKRVHAHIQRLRQWQAQSGLPFEIREEESFYRFVATGAFSVRVPLERNTVSGYLPLLQVLKKSFAEGETFSAKDARLCLGMSRSSLQRFITWAKESGRLEQLGDYNFTSYRLVGAEPSKDPSRRSA